jgi:hypothetical protein
MALAALLLLTLAACAAPTPETNVPAEPTIPQVFAQEQQPEDTRSGALIERFEEDSEIEPDSLRLLGTQDNTAFYAARDEAGAICLINIIDAAAEPTLAWSCASPEQFARMGEFVVVESGGHYAAAMFVPDGYTDNLRAQFPDAVVRDNLLAFSSYSAVTDAIDTHGGEVVLTDAEQGTLTIPLAALR